MADDGQERADRVQNGPPSGGSLPADIAFSDPRREPVFNLPPVLIALAALLTAIHLVRASFLSQEADWALILSAAFIPASYGPDGALLPMPNSWMWSPVTYALLHASWLHLSVNLLWMIAFGTPVARRLGSVRFLGLSLVAALAGALTHFAFHPFDRVPVIGASACVSAYMGAAARFAFAGAGRPGAGFRHDGPALSLFQSLTDRRVAVFLLVWMVLNYVFGSGIALPGAGDAQTAWEAHVGGFLTGLVLFSFFDPQRPAGTVTG